MNQMKCLEYIQNTIRLTEHSPLNETERGSFFETTRREALNQAKNMIEADEELQTAWRQYNNSQIKIDLECETIEAEKAVDKLE